MSDDSSTTDDGEKSKPFQLSDNNDSDVDDEEDNESNGIDGTEGFNNGNQTEDMDEDHGEEEEEEEDGNDMNGDDVSAATQEESFELDDKNDETDYDDVHSDDDLERPGADYDDEDEDDDDDGDVKGKSNVNVDVAEEEEEDDDDSDEEENDGPPQSQLEAWTQVHQELQRAVAIAREAVESKRMQRRFWLETICANLTENGNLAPHSVWKRPVAPKRGAEIRKRTGAGQKRTSKVSGMKSPKGSASTARKRPLSSAHSDSDDEEEDDDPQESRVRSSRHKLRKTSPYQEESSESTEDEDDEDDEDRYEEDNDGDGDSETETSSMLKYPMHHTASAHRSPIQHPYMAAARSSISCHGTDRNPYIVAAEAAKEGIYSTFGAVASGDGPSVEDSESEEDPF